MDDLARVVASARSVFVLTGAGMSAESGLPTFRGAGGYWNDHRVEDLASPLGFARDPASIWAWYNERIRAYRCGGTYRPQVVWFGEALPARPWDAASQAGDAAIYEFNPDATPLSSRCAQVFREPAASALFRLAASVRDVPAKD